MKHMLGLCAAVVMLGACQGPKGDPGEAGPAGAQGPQGPQGNPGPLPIIATGGGLSGDGTSGSPLAVASGGVTAEHIAGPVRIYSRLMTPRWLEANADFHSARLSTITDTSVSFGAAGTGNVATRLLTVPLLPPNTLKPNESYLVRIVVNQLVASADCDPIFGITDGTSYIGILKADSGNAEAADAVVGTYGNNLTAITTTALGGPGQDAQNFEFLLHLGPVAGGNTPVFFTSRIGTLAGRHQADSPIDRSGIISFAIFGGDPAELYTFQSLEVTIERQGG